MLDARAFHVPVVVYAYTQAAKVQRGPSNALRVNDHHLELGRTAKELRRRTD